RPPRPRPESRPRVRTRPRSLRSPQRRPPGREPPAVAPLRALMTTNRRRLAPVTSPATPGRVAHRRPRARGRRVEGCRVRPAAAPSHPAPAASAARAVAAGAGAAGTAAAASGSGSGALSDVPLRRGLPRTAGGDPWPPEGFAPAGAAKPAAGTAEPVAEATAPA